jgi:DNA-binding transcriptional LysR family regulator
MLDVRRMRVLREVAVRGSFSAAAESLSFTQSAISQQIAALEREAGAVLVERSARGVRLTEAGEAVVRHTDAILARLAEAEAELESIAGLKGGRLRIAAFESAASTLMPLAIAAFRERHPGVDLTLALLEPEEALPQLRSGELDLALVFSSGDPRETADIEYRHLLDDPLYLALPATHPLADKRGLRLADVSGDPWLAGPGDCECNRLINRSCAIAGFDPRIVFETADYTAMQGFIAAGVGVSLIAELGLTTMRDGVVVRSLGRETPVRRVHAAVPAGGYRSPAASAMLDVLEAVAGQYAAQRPPRLELVGSAPQSA